MCRLLETIKCLDGKLYNLKEHNARFNASRKEYFGISGKIKLEEIITVPDNCKKGWFRCRIVYGKNIESMEFVPHLFREVKSLKIVENNLIDYRYKYADRQNLNELFELRENCDDILIVKNGCVTDSSIANLIFFDGRKWVTPDTPLLPGTQRHRLLQNHKITECRISPDDIIKYKKAGLINAMWDLDNLPEISIENICR